MCALVLLLNTSDLNRSVTEILPKSVFQYYQDRTDGRARQRSILERPEKTPSGRVQTSPSMNRNGIMTDTYTGFRHRILQVSVAKMSHSPGIVMNYGLFATYNDDMTSYRQPGITVYSLRTMMAFVCSYLGYCS